MDSIFPFIDPEIIEEPLPMARELAFDTDKLDFKLKGGKMYQVEGKEAVKIWLWKLIQTHRYRYLIFDWDYGTELETLIGRGNTQGYLNSEAERMVREAIDYNLSDYVTEVRNMTTEFRDDVLKMEFTAVTPYGEVEMIV